ncbi:hypothetical protein DFQ00_114144 [Paenibacillus barcinonensis]|uniref:Uncharacterized protein n=1 Tax=Paenibacillus barcinonensis TaxID=198119 RepID=A0A2V4VM96_PAEBA|nr:hypothetical protein DFQ00_114144 [Paenibacillus barcinonensis]
MDLMNNLCKKFQLKRRKLKFYVEFGLLRGGDKWEVIYHGKQGNFICTGFDGSGG